MNGILEQILDIVLRIDSRVINAEKAIENLKSTDAPNESWLDINQLCQYHPEHPTKATIYSWVHKSIIPFRKKGKRLLFLKSEIDDWLLNGKLKSVNEIQKNAEENFLKANSKKGRNEI